MKVGGMGLRELWELHGDVTCIVLVRAKVVNILAEKHPWGNVSTKILDCCNLRYFYKYTTIIHKFKLTHTS